MKRHDEVQIHFQKAQELVVTNAFYQEHITQLFQWMVQADRVDHDVTSLTLALTGESKAQIVSKQQGMVAGLEELDFLLKKNTPLTFSPLVVDGEMLSKNDVVAEVTGKNKEILAYERTILNIIGRMSGIATEARSLISLIENISPAPTIAAIRKTPMMMLDKKAVAVGGGLTHRLSLADEILIKDNHLGMLQKELGLATSEHAAQEAVKRCMQSAQNYFEIEVDTLSQANAVLHTFARENAQQKNQKMMAILLDNFKPADATRFVESLKKLPLFESVLIEASGEITGANIATWATTGVDVVSLGALTHSPKVFNFSMQY